MQEPKGDPYHGREQTKAKHFILRHYLERLAFKILTFSDLTYIDGFSGPWETKTESFSDSSFMIAIEVLKGVQARMTELHGTCRRIRCFFSELDPNSYTHLCAAVAPYHRPAELFEITTRPGQFEDAIAEIQTCIGSSFALIFIDPTGWTGYPFDKIRPLLEPRKCEVLINFMYDFINRFASRQDDEAIRSLSPILGGDNWPARLDPSLPRGAAVEKLFRQSLKEAGRFKFVVSTKIDKATAERPHFFLAYGTKSADGLKVFRDTEYLALREHARSRANAKERKREGESRTAELFAGHEADVQEETIDDLVDQQKRTASKALLDVLRAEQSLLFKLAQIMLLERFMLRETDAKDICVELAQAGHIQNSWGSGNRKPRDDTVLKLSQ